MPVHKVTNADKPAEFSGSLEDIQKLFPKQKVSHTRLSDVPGNLPTSTPPPPAAAEAARVVAAYIAARKAWQATNTQDERDAAYAEVVRIHEAEAAAGRSLGVLPKPDSIRPIVVVDVATDMVNLLKRKAQELAAEFRHATHATDPAMQAKVVPEFDAVLEQLKAATKIKDGLAKFATEQLEVEIVLTSLVDVLARKSQTEWLPGLDEILERKVLAVMAGQRGTFKSFITLDWCLRAALAGCGVVMLSGEGGGLDRRIDAWLREHGKGIELEKLRFVALEKPVNLNEQQTLDMVAAAVRGLGWESVDILVVDTMSKFTPGLDEQDNTGNAEFLYKLSAAIRYQFDTSVLLVDHEGHNAVGRPRGASVKMANPDAEYMVKRNDPEAYEVSITRQRFKDSPQLPDLTYVGKTVDLERVDRNMRPISSLVFHRSNAPASVERKPAPAKLKGNAHIAWEALKGLFASAAAAPKDAPKCVPKNVVSLNEEVAIEAMRPKFRTGKHQRRNVERGIDGLIKARYIVRGDGWIWPRLELSDNA
jgi:hypothetical protein